MTRKAGPQLARAAALAIVRTLRSAGHIAYFAGGCVRDELLGLAPTDFDIATDATPARIAEIFRRTNEVGAAFGVVLVTLGTADGLEGQATVEVATFRSEGPYSDRRRPDRVSFSDPKADALRRDFTVNALFLDPLSSDASLPPAPLAGATLSPAPAGGTVIDFVRGIQDLNGRIIRAVGDPDQRLAEDHLRALRAVRLSARLGFALDPATAAAIHRHARDLAGVSRERIGDEVRRMLQHPSRGPALARLQELELDLPVLQESPQNPPLRILNSLALQGSPTEVIATSLAAWSVDRGCDLEPGAIAQTTARYRRALCLSNPETELLQAILTCLGRLAGEWESLTEAQQKRLAGAQGFAQAYMLLEAMNATQAAAIGRRVEHLATTPSGLAPPPLLTGDDLVAAGYPPGPSFKQILDRVYDAQLEGRVNSRTQAMELAKNLRI